MGVTAGAYVLSLFAVCLTTKFLRSPFSETLLLSLYELGRVITSPFCGFIKTDDNDLGGVQCKYTERALGLILVSPVAQSTSWTEWLHNQVCHRIHTSIPCIKQVLLTFLISLVLLRIYTDLTLTYGQLILAGYDQPSLLLWHDRLCQRQASPTLFQFGRPRFRRISSMGRGGNVYPPSKQTTLFKITHVLNQVLKLWSLPL